MSKAKQPPPGQPRQSKVRSDAVLHGLPEEEQLAIIQELKTKSAEEVSKRLRERSPSVVISVTGVYRFAQYWRAQFRFLEASGQRESLMVQMTEKQPSAKLKELESWGDLLFLQTALAKDDLKGYTNLRAVMERAKQTQLDAKRLAILENKEKKLAAVEEALKDRKAAGGLSPEALELMEAALGIIQSP